jgi:negative regulator of replication initiation
MADTIEYFGVEDVRALQFTVNGIELVSTSKHPKYDQAQVGKFFVCTHSNTESKKKMLERLAIRLNRPLTVEVV